MGLLLTITSSRCLSSAIVCSDSLPGAISSGGLAGIAGAAAPVNNAFLPGNSVISFLPSGVLHEYFLPGYFPQVSLCCHVLKHFFHIDPDDQARTLFIGSIAFQLDDPFYETGDLRRESLSKVFDIGFCNLEDAGHFIDNDPDIAAGCGIRYEYR